MMSQRRQPWNVDRGPGLMAHRLRSLSAVDYSEAEEPMAQRTKTADQRGGRDLPPGPDVDDWMAAEQEVLSELGSRMRKVGD